MTTASKTADAARLERVVEQLKRVSSDLDEINKRMGALESHVRRHLERGGFPGAAA